jgi:hypothetical protein
MVPVGGEPSAKENQSLALALQEYSRRSRPDDLSALTRFLERHASSPWKSALLSSMGVEYYKTAHYSLALEAWKEAWSLGQRATDSPGRFAADDTLCELAQLYSRLGRMNDLAALL